MSGVIRTPDQRIRVFVSSTLKELAPERGAARAAIERLHLAPVMFELGARPHPPRELYRAYLEQSDVFVGLYGERYGWIAPDEQVSGLEDEYNLVPATVPKLIYIKEPAEAREPRLAELLARIRDDDSASFKYVGSVAELEVVLESDLATLLAERFDQSRAGTRSGEDRAAVTLRNRLPEPLTSLIGRENNIQELTDLLGDGGARLVTLIGPGGIGKTRLAIEVAREVGSRFVGGTAFVPLATVRDPERVLSAIAQAVGVRDIGDAPLSDKLVIALRERRTLVVLDNFEQVVSAAPAVASLLADVSDLQIMVTSRAPLRVSGERTFEVEPLDTDTEGPLSPAVQLFVDRARAVKPRFELSPENRDVVGRICVALDGLPLAIELAAARIRLLSPASLLERLDRTLTILIGGARDLPERQQTLRGAIEWSVGLLDEQTRTVFTRLGVFRGGFSLEAAEATVLGGAEVDVFAVLGDLVDNSLVTERDRGTWTQFLMLSTIREFALGQLSDDELDELHERQAQYYLGWADRIQTDLEGPHQRELVQRLNDERDNLRSVQRYLLDSRSFDRAAHLAMALFVYWWVNGDLGEVRRWADTMLADVDALDDTTQAIALYFRSFIGYWQDEQDVGEQRLARSAELFHDAGEPIGEALALTMFGVAVLSAPSPGLPQAIDAFERAIALFRGSGYTWGEAHALITLGRCDLVMGRPDAA
ncbi:ATP-binding protein [Leifsonia sp. NPDC056824]|uniref:ATP-binding protein n=1 Tax=Leifsonia sp. NPDC056824 TaxID=3345953 RepID=UPI0036888105